MSLNIVKTACRFRWAHLLGIILIAGVIFGGLFCIPMDNAHARTPADTMEDITHSSRPAFGHEAVSPPDGHPKRSRRGTIPISVKACPLWSVIPFACMLLSIALMPLLAPDFWHHHFGKVLRVLGRHPWQFRFSLFTKARPSMKFFIFCWQITCRLLCCSGPCTRCPADTLLRGTLRGTPLVNTVLLIVGTVLASWMGTTGAAMLLIRPFLRANSFRKSRTFMVVFFIFLVANIGGSLTPLGDPPLFLGFLHGVSFFWTFNILPHMLFATVVLLVIYFMMDSYFYRKEVPDGPPDDGVKEPLRLEGIHNFIFLLGIVGAVLASGILEWPEVQTLGVHRALQDWARDGFSHPHGRSVACYHFL